MNQSQSQQPNTDELVKQLREAHEKSTKGEWRSQHGSIYSSNDKHLGGFNTDLRLKETNFANANSTALTHNHLPIILDELDQLKAATRYIPVEESLPENPDKNKFFDVVVEITWQGGNKDYIRQTARFMQGEFLYNATTISKNQGTRVSHWKEQIPLPEVPQC